MTTETPLGPGREFDAIRALLARWGTRAHAIGDDAAIVDVPSGTKLVVSTDTSVEQVHFRRAWLTPEEIGWRATTAALSDLAAMGADPLGVLAAITVPATWRNDLLAIGDGIANAADVAGCRIVGGDLTAGNELVLAMTVLGSARSPLTRAGARPGDALWVSGSLGGPGAALRAWLGGNAPSAEARARFAHPSARIELGRRLSAAGCSAAIDISDGLIGDAGHLAAASGSEITVDLGMLPVFGDVEPSDAAASGEEYELLFTAPADFPAQRLEHETGVKITRIGSVGSGTARVVATMGGARVEFSGGHDHFSR